LCGRRGLTDPSIVGGRQAQTGGQSLGLSVESHIEKIDRCFSLARSELGRVER